MKLTTVFLFFGLLTPLSGIAAVTDVAAGKEQSMAQAYLEHWFSVDSAEPLSLTQTPLPGDALGRREEIRFTSDDGQPVNGIIAYPVGKPESNKLALALHPMGADQHFWWSDKSPLPVHSMASTLRQQGYTVISLDARRHGERGTKEFGPRELLEKAHSDEPRLYTETIVGSVRDYRLVLKWAQAEIQPSEVLVMGYSMGAQMSLLLASFEPQINKVLVMVPPYVGSSTSPVAPRVHLHRISDAEVLWLAGSKDPYSNSEQTQETFDRIKSQHKTLTWFDAGHRLPAEFVSTAQSFLRSTTKERK